MTTLAVLALLVLPLDLADQIRACPEVGCFIQLNPGETVETKPCSLRTAAGEPLLGLMVIGSENTVVCTPPENASTLACIDATDAERVLFAGWTLTTLEGGGVPRVGLLLANTGDHRFDRWRIDGWFSEAAVMEIDAGCSDFKECWHFGNVWIQSRVTNHFPGAKAYRESCDYCYSPAQMYGCRLKTTSLLCDCLTGPSANTPAIRYGCEEHDADGDGDVDLMDLHVSGDRRAWPR